MSTRPIRSGVRGYCPFKRRGQGGDIARAAGELTETAPDATTILSRDDGDLGVERIGSATAREPNSSHLYSEQFRSAQGPAAHSTGRVEVRQTDCADGGP